MVKSGRTSNKNWTTSTLNLQVTISTGWTLPSRVLSSKLSRLGSTKLRSSTMLRLKNKECLTTTSVQSDSSLKSIRTRLMLRREERRRLSL